MSIRLAGSIVIGAIVNTAAASITTTWAVPSSQSHRNQPYRNHRRLKPLAFDKFSARIANHIVNRNFGCSNCRSFNSLDRKFLIHMIGYYSDLNSGIPDCCIILIRNHTVTTIDYIVEFVKREHSFCQG